jgi:hypothetical protein
MNDRTHRGSVLGAGLLSSDGGEIRAPTGELPEGAGVVWCVRPERISLSPEGRYAAILLDDVDLGSVRELTISLNGRLGHTVRTDETRELTVGQPLRLELPREDILVWRERTAAKASLPLADRQPPM